MKVWFYNIKLISQKSTHVMLLARFFLQRIMFIKCISTYKSFFFKYELTAYIPLFVVKFAITRQISPQKWNISKLGFIFFMNIILCKKNLARSITLLDFWLIRLNHTFTLILKVKIDMHIEKCNVVVIIKYVIKSMKTLEDTIS